SRSASSRRPEGRSNSASTYASGWAGPTYPASPLAPSSSPIACARIVLPAPVSPVITFSPGPKDSSASLMSTRFSMRRLRSKRLAVAVEERHLWQQREQRALFSEPHGRLAVCAEVAPGDPVRDHLPELALADVLHGQLQPARNHERARMQRVRR